MEEESFVTLRPGDLVVLAGQVFHAAHLSPEFVDVADLTDATDALWVTSSCGYNLNALPLTLSSWSSFIDNVSTVS
jgi:hypothetical protein